MREREREREREEYANLQESGDPVGDSVTVKQCNLMRKKKKTFPSNSKVSHKLAFSMRLEFSLRFRGEVQFQ